MSDLKGIEISDVFGLKEPLTKLLEVSASGIGKIYEPVHVKRMAKARAEEVRIVGETLAESPLPMASYSTGQIELSSSIDQELIQRANNRIAFVEAKKQNNIENILKLACNELQNIDYVTDEPVNTDWINNFFEFAGNVSDSEMQIIWGKILAGEVSNPNTCSIRTLDLLRKITSYEAKQFENILPYVLKCSGDTEKSYYDYFLPCITEDDSMTVSSKYYSFPSIIALDEAGLISANSMVSVGIPLDSNSSDEIVGNGQKIIIKNNASSKVDIRHQAYLLTRAGRELYMFLAKSSDIPKVSKEYLSDFISSIEYINELGPAIVAEITV